MSTRPSRFVLPAVLAALMAALPLRALTVGGLRLERSASGYLLKVATSSKAAPRVEALTGKILIVVPGGERSLKTVVLASGPVERIRFGRQGRDLRVVLDLREKVRARLEKVSDGSFTVLLAPRAGRAEAPAAAAPANKGAAAPASATAGVADLSPSRVGYTYRVVDLSLGGDSDHSRLVISADGPADYSSSVRDRGRLIRLEFRDSALAWGGDPASLEDDAIAAVSVRQISVDGESRVRVDLKLSGPLGYAFKRDQNQVVVVLQRPVAPAKPQPKGDLSAPVSLDVQDADLVGVLKALCEQAGFSYQFTRTLLTKAPPDSLVTMKAQDRPFREVVDTLLQQVQCRELRLGNTIYMGTANEIETRRNSIPVVTRGYTPKYLTINQDMAYLLNRYLNDADEQARIHRGVGRDLRDPDRIAVVGTPEEVEDWIAFLKAGDVPEPGEDSGDDGEGSGPRTQIYHLNYLDNSNSGLINGAIAQLYPEGEQAPQTLIDPATRTLVVTTTPRYLRKIAKLLAKLDARPAQVNIEGKIVEVDQSAVSQLGINWTAVSNYANITTSNSNVAPPGFGQINAGVAESFSSNFTLGTIVNHYGIGMILATINALVQQQKAEIVTAPNITTIDNQAATLGLIQTQVYEQETSTITNGVAVNTFTYPTSSLPLTLNVTPKISRADHRVLMNINFQLTSANGTPLQQGAPLPTEQEEAITNVSVPSGDTYVIGGLVTQDNTQAVYKVPILGDIPLIGLLFKYTSIDKSKKDIIVFIKPTIVGE